MHGQIMQMGCVCWLEYSLFLVCCILLTISGLCHSMPCHWMGQITPRVSSSSTSIFSNRDTMIQITEDLKRLQVFNMMSSESENISAYRFYVLAKIGCSANEDPSSVGKALFRKGGGATITISYSSQGVNGKYLMQREFSLDGAPVEMDQSCSSVVCNPAWMVPLPISRDHHIVTVQLSTRGGWHGIHSSAYAVHFDGYFNVPFVDETIFHMVGDDISDENIQDFLPSLEPTTLCHMPPLILPMFLLGPDKTLIYSTNFFADAAILQVHPPPNAILCHNEVSSLLVTLPDRILYLDAGALYEIIGHFAAVPPRGEGFIPVDLGMCITRVLISPHSHLAEWFVYLVGQHETAVKIFQARYQTGQPLTFSDVEEATSSDACDFFSDSQTGVSLCSILDGAVSSTTPEDALFLVKIASDEDDHEYSIVKLTGRPEARTWVLVSSFPCSTPTYSDMCSWNETISLNRITSTAMVSRVVFLWGSLLFDSFDDGLTWHLVQDYDASPIVLLTTSTNGQFAILNEDQEIWYGLIGSSVSVSKVKPSFGWHLHEMMNSEASALSNGTISLFFDQSNVLREVIRQRDPNGNLSISSVILSVAEILQLEKQSTLIKSKGSDKMLCPFKQLLPITTYSEIPRRQEYYQLSPPAVTRSELHNEDSLLVYQGVVGLILKMREIESVPSYSGDLYNPMEQWLSRRRLLESFHDYLYRNNLLQENIGIHVPLETFQNNGIQIKSGTVFSVPSEIFLDKHDTYSFKIQMKGWPLSEDVDDITRFIGTDNLFLMVEVSHLDLLQVDLTRHVRYISDSVEYDVHVKDLAGADHQAPPGQHLLTTSLTIEAWNSAFNCYEEKDGETNMKGLVTMNVFHGCPPGRVLQYDIHGTIFYNGASSVYDCPHVNPELPCSYFKQDFHPLFEILDLTTGESEPFTGKYTLKVIGGQGMNEAEMTYFTEEQIAQFNWLGRNSLIWTPSTTQARYQNMPVFERAENGLVWHCQQFSPCADVPLKFPWTPEYTLMIEVSNKDVDSSSTYCEYSVQFMVKIHGIPVSSIRSVRIVAWCLVISFAIIGVFLACDWNDKRIWRKTKLRVRQGFRVHPKEGSQEWSIQRSESGSETSQGGHFQAEALKLSRGRAMGQIDTKKPEISWNLSGEWKETPLGHEELDHDPDHFEVQDKHSNQEKL